MKGNPRLFLYGIALCAPLWFASQAGCQVFNLSGGGTDLIFNAIESATPTGGTILITDNGTYTESQVLLVGQRSSGVYGRRSFHIEAAPGTTPTIEINGGGFVMYAGSADVHIGTATGGRILIDCLGSTLPGSNGLFWYIGQEDGLASGAACQAVLENLTVDYTNAAIPSIQEGVVFGAGGNDATPQTTGASITLRDVMSIGSVVPVRSLYGPADYASTVNVENSQILEFNDFFGAELGAFGLGGVDSVMNLDHTIIYTSASTTSLDHNSVVGRLGTLNIDHCDIISETPGVDRAITLVGGSCFITNSIIHADAGTINFGSGASTADDCNVTARSVPNVGFVYTNVLESDPLAATYITYGLDFSNPDNFRVFPTSQSASWGGDPPLGSVGAGAAPPSSNDNWNLYE